MAAAKLPRVAIESPPRVIGRGTVEAMQSGIFWGYVSMIEGMVRRIQDETESKMQVIATGGLAPLFSEATDSIERADTNLTLYGLLSVHRRNRAQ
jgi:type III pantothenate kinase